MHAHPHDLSRFDPLDGRDGLSLKASVAGQWLGASAWEALAALARLGDGALYLTASGNYRVRGLQEADVPAAVELLEALCGESAASEPLEDRGSQGSTVRIGWTDTEDGTVELGAVLPLGRLSAQLADIFGILGARVRSGRDARILLAGLEEGVAEQALRVLAPAGMVFDAASPWAQVSACVGAPRCPHGLSAVQEDAVQLARSGVETRTHLVGCAERCGEPVEEHVLYVASGEGEYDVEDIEEKPESAR